jgi:hypothetical protein
VAVVGEGTGKVLEAAGVPPTFTPSKAYGKIMGSQLPHVPGTATRHDLLVVLLGVACTSLISKSPAHRAVVLCQMAGAIACDAVTPSVKTTPHASHTCMHAPT